MTREPRPMPVWLRALRTRELQRAKASTRAEVAQQNAARAAEEQSYVAPEEPKKGRDHDR